MSPNQQIADAVVDWIDKNVFGDDDHLAPWNEETKNKARKAWYEINTKNDR